MNLRRLLTSIGLALLVFAILAVLMGIVYLPILFLGEDIGVPMGILFVFFLTLTGIFYVS